MIKTSTIPPPPKRLETISKNATTREIMDLVLSRLAEPIPKGFCQFAKQFKPNKQGLEKLFCWMLDNIQYRFDGFEFQDVQSPLHLNKTRAGDCKSFTVFASWVFRCLDVPFKVRFAAYKKGDVTHVYNLVKIKGQWLPFDVVAKKKWCEAPYKKNIDVMPELRAIGKIGNRELPQTVINQRVADEKPVDVSFTAAVADLSVLRNQTRIMRQLAQTKAEKNQYAAAENLITRAINAAKTGSAVSWGSVPQNLQGVAAAANAKLANTMPALSPFISSFSAADARVIGKKNNCIETDTLFFPDSGKFRFGAGTPFAISESEALGALQRARNKYGYTIEVKGKGPFRKRRQVYCFKSEIDQSKFLKDIGQWSGVFSNYLNDLYKVNDKAGTATLYNYINTEAVAVTPPPGGKGAAGADRTGIVETFNLNELPSVVTTKTLLQNQYTEAVGFFSGAAQGLLRSMGRNTILPVSGGVQPEKIIKTFVDVAKGLKSLFSRKDKPQIGEPVSIGIAIAIINAVVLGVEKIVKATQGAKEVDAAAVAAAQLTPISEGNAPAESDWEKGAAKGPSNDTGENGSGSENSGNQAEELLKNPLLWAGGAAALYYFTKK